MDSSRMNRGCCGANNMQNFKQYGTEDGTKEFPAENAACRSYDTCNGVRSDAAV